MVAREIRERGGLEAHGGDPILLDRVRGDLHADAFGAELAQRRELTMNVTASEVVCSRRSELRRYTESQRAHVCRTPVADLKRLREQPGTGRLAVGPGDAGHGERLRGRAEETIRDGA